MKAKTMTISGKTSDLFSASVYDKDNNELFDYNGYVPNFFPGDHYGDYIQLDIDLATGKILNWVPPTEDQINDLNPKEDEDE